MASSDNFNILPESIMSIVAKHSGVSTLIGTPKEAQARTAGYADGSTQGAGSAYGGTTMECG